MRPSEVLRRAADYLERHGVESPRENAEALLMRILETDRTGLYLLEEGLNAEQARRFGRALCRRCAGTPLQHLTGEQAFRRLRLSVRPDVFVPRPETEVVVDVALSVIERVRGPRVVDVGTGSGAIALAIKDEHPDAVVWATDRSAAAVELARANAAHLGLEVDVREGDLLSPLPGELRGRLDLVVSNPPYVTPSEFADLPAEVQAEPTLALLGGIDTIARLAGTARPWLRSGGALVLEIGSTQREEVVAVLTEGYAEVRVEPDLAGRDRVAVARRP